MSKKKVVQTNTPVTENNLEAQLISGSSDTDSSDTESSEENTPAPTKAQRIVKKAAASPPPATTTARPPAASPPAPPATTTARPPAARPPAPPATTTAETATAARPPAAETATAAAPAETAPPGTPPAAETATATAPPPAKKIPTAVTLNNELNEIITEFNKIITINKTKTIINNVSGNEDNFNLCYMLINNIIIKNIEGQSPFEINDKFNFFCIHNEAYILNELLPNIESIHEKTYALFTNIVNSYKLNNKSRSNMIMVKLILAFYIYAKYNIKYVQPNIPAAVIPEMTTEQIFEEATKFYYCYTLLKKDIYNPPLWSLNTNKANINEYGYTKVGDVNWDLLSKKVKVFYTKEKDEEYMTHFEEVRLLLTRREPVNINMDTTGYNHDKYTAFLNDFSDKPEFEYAFNNFPPGWESRTESKSKSAYTKICEDDNTKLLQNFALYIETPIKYNDKIEMISVINCISFMFDNVLQPDYQHFINTVNNKFWSNDDTKLHECIVQIFNYIFECAHLYNKTILLLSFFVSSFDIFLFL